MHNNAIGTKFRRQSRAHSFRRRRFALKEASEYNPSIEISQFNQFKLDRRRRNSAAATRISVRAGAGVSLRVLEYRVCRRSLQSANLRQPTDTRSVRSRSCSIPRPPSFTVISLRSRTLERFGIRARSTLHGYSAGLPPSLHSPKFAFDAVFAIDCRS